MTGACPPLGLQWRSSTAFILATVAIGLFTDMFLYGLVVPVLPFLLRDRLSVPNNEIQSNVSGLLAAYAGAQLLCSVPAGWIADRTNTRQIPFLCGLTALLGATVLLAVGQSIAVLMLARVLQGMSASVVWTIGLAMIRDTVGPQNLGKAIGSIFSILSIGPLVSPVVGGILYDKTGYVGVFGVGSALLVIDFVMRLLLIEKKVAAKYDSSLAENGTNPRTDETSDEPSEEDALLQRKQEERYEIRGEQNKLVRAVPVLYCLRNPRLLVAFIMAFVQAALLAAFDATIPIEALDLFGFSSLKAGLLFIALNIPCLILGPVAGWAVDRFGTKPVAVTGFSYFVPVLLLLRLPPEKLVGRSGNIALYCALLALNGIGLAVVDSPSFVEASDVVQRYDKANPGFFGANGPYAQLYGFNSMFFCAGLTLGPIISGTLRDSIGYGNMNAVLAGAAGFTAVVSFLVVGGKPRIGFGRTQ
ncbi:MFS general substrate transporter [Apiospora saccharicola]|uniref:MFS general substrate transporter n=1 Tax=Apiospora saccharicola TaxID=335842 RepID=A0ABR1TJB9_9PEZI